MTAVHKEHCEGRGEYIFTSESVSEGHPDKVCDQISDAILDAYLREDPFSRVACETLATKNRLVLSGEIASRAKVDHEKVAREVIRKIGYTEPELNFDDSCEITDLLHQQTLELNENKGAGDQGLMFGYACSQCEALMPLPIEISQALLKELTALRKDGTLFMLYPDSKSQVSIRYQGREPKRIENVVISTNHKALSDAEYREMQELITEKVVKKVLAEYCGGGLNCANVKIQINPLGAWHNGGPAADTGLTGRKIIVDTYGGWAPHGGGAFSGKDPTKVDRSAAYMARHIAKSVVGSGLAKECLLQLSFVIGEIEPVSLMVDTKGSGIISDSEIENLIRQEFDLTVNGIIEYLDLRKPIYFSTAAYGHFGMNAEGMSWEKIKELKN
ncbi:MAG: methionine adenosyltransferase [Candidatus Cloacimonetes bacterium]|nr:methionine adenosyltransferase [Candidatus Cloacimonadota bacterium]